jgi:MATE family multidrug resistance protein
MPLYVLVWVVDTALIGNWGNNTAVSAVGLSTEILYTISNMFIAQGIAVGIATMVAQNIGAEKKKKQKSI